MPRDLLLLSFGGTDILGLAMYMWNLLARIWKHASACSYCKPCICLHTFPRTAHHWKPTRVRGAALNPALPTWVGNNHKVVSEHGSNMDDMSLKVSLDRSPLSKLQLAYASRSPCTAQSSVRTLKPCYITWARSRAGETSTGYASGLDKVRNKVENRVIKTQGIK